MARTYSLEDEWATPSPEAPVPVAHVSDATQTLPRTQAPDEPVEILPFAADQEAAPAQLPPQQAPTTSIRTPGTSIQRVYTGVLQRLNGFQRMLTPYEMELVSPTSDKRIGYVDLSEAIRPWGDNHYLDKPVVIRGTLKEDGKQQVIRASHIHLDSPR